MDIPAYFYVEELNDAKDVYIPSGIKLGTELVQQMQQNNCQTCDPQARTSSPQVEVLKKPLYVRSSEASRTLEHTIASLVDADTAKRLDDAIANYESIMSDVYFSLGMKAGARLNDLLMGGFDRDY